MNFFRKSKPIISNTKDIEDFLSRGVENVFPSKEMFAKALGSGKQLSIYLGIDPTGPTLHMGHAIPLLKLSKLQKMGHRIVLLIGDFTAMIGDPDKQSVRKQLTRKEVLANCRLYKKQASKFLSFSGSNAAKLVYNSTWLSGMNFADVVKLASNMTVQQMIERDMFDKRLKEGRPIYLHEFLYPLMQGYDSVALNVDAEIGGNDQTFNMLSGRNLMKSLKNKEKFVVAVRLLADPTGKKMGKTEGNMITLLDSPSEMFGKVMSWSDGMIITGFELCTTVSADEISKEKIALESGANPRDVKLRLASAVVDLYYGKEAAKKSLEVFLATFSSAAGASMPDDAPELPVTKGALLSDVLLEAGIVSSKTDYKRLATDRAIKNVTSGAEYSDFNQKVEVDMDIRIGKHRFAKIRVK